MKKPIIPIILFFLLFQAAVAQDDELYDPAPPANAAFVRIIHAAPGTDNITASIGETSYGDIGYQGVTPYRVVPQGDRTISVGALQQPANVEAGKFYTVVVLNGPNGPLVAVLEDAINTNRARALIALYNLTELETIALKTADGATDVIIAVAPNEVKGIIVNPISVAFGIFASDELLATFEQIQLARGAAYSAILMGSVENPQAIFVQSETTTRQD